MQRRAPRKKQVSRGGRRRKILPAVFVLLSLLLMILPLESPVSSAKAVLSYVFIPQIRAAHDAVEYANGVSESVRSLLQTDRENERLKEELSRLRLENAQAQEWLAENLRLTQALKLKAPRGWTGVWAKTAYREPTQWNSVIIDKGAAEGVRQRAAVIAQQNGRPVLAGAVVEVNEHTAKVLLLQDEDFYAAVYGRESGEEGLLSGGGAGALKLQYLPLLSKLREGEAVYTSPSSRLFPAGILVGEVTEIENGDGFRTALSARVDPAADAASIRELFVLTRDETEQTK